MLWGAHHNTVLDKELSPKWWHKEKVGSVEVKIGKNSVTMVEQQNGDPTIPVLQLMVDQQPHNALRTVNLARKYYNLMDKAGGTGEFRAVQTVG